MARRRETTGIFTSLWVPTARGSGHRITVTCISRQFRETFLGDPTLGGAGLLQIRGGLGLRTSHSVGPVTTMAAGHCSEMLAGSGFPAVSGHRPGFLGGKVPAMLAGRRCPRKRLATGIVRGIPPSIPPSGSMMAGTPLSPTIILETASSNTASHAPRASSSSGRPLVSRATTSRTAASL